MKKQLLLWWLLCLGVLAPLAAQTRLITGKVLDEADAPLPGVAVQIKGTTKGSISDVNGEFKLQVDEAQGVLTFRLVGYQTMEVPIAGKSVMQVALKEDATTLDEVVVTALGIERDRRSLGYAAQEVKSADLIKAREANLVNALSGRIAGVQITNTSGAVGASSRIVLRGTASISGENQPLFVVDGMPLSNDTFATGTGTSVRGANRGNAISDINPDDIESVTILKGNAAALYGSRGANGVVVITTKRGKHTRGLGISVNSSTTFENPLRLPDFQNQYGQGSEGKFSYVDGNGSGVNDDIDESWGPKLDGRLIPQFDSPVINGVRQSTPWVAQPDNVKDFFRTGLTLSNNISLQGGDENSNFRISYGFQDQQGILDNTYMKRHTLSAAGQMKMGKRVDADASLNYAKSEGLLPGFGATVQNVMYQFIWFGRQVNTASLKPYKDADGNLLNWNSSYHNNPYFTLNENLKTQQRDRLYGTARLRYHLNDWLSAHVRTGMDWYQNVSSMRSAYGDMSDAKGYYSLTQNSFWENNTDVLLSASKTWGAIQASANVGGNLMLQRRSSMFGEALALAVPGVYNLGNASGTPSLSNFSAEKRISSVYGTVDLSYKQALNVQFTARNDWSTTLPKNNRSYFYPGVNVSVIANELVPSLKDLSFLNQLKLRAGWSKVGSDTDPYRLFNVYAATDAWAGAQPAFTTPDRNNNDKLRPEMSTNKEAGLDVSLFNNRLGFEVTYYDRLTEDQIMPVPVSWASGFSSAMMNAGAVSNKGVELTLSGTPLKVGDFSWDVTLNWARNRNRVESLSVPTYVMGSYAGVEIQANVGNAMGDIFARTFVRDEQGNVVHDSKGRPMREATAKLVGNVNPDWTGGLYNSFAYKGVRLGVLLDMRYGGDLYSRTYLTGRYSGVLAETLEGREDGLIGKGVKVTGTGSDGKPTYAPNDIKVSAEYYNHIYSTNSAGEAVFDASYLKLREVSLSYTLPNKWLGSKSPIRDLSISVVGRNLMLLYSNVPHIDPETSFGNDNVQGLEFGQIPSTRSLGFNINFKL